MADNVTLNSMSGGSVVATDDSGTGHVQVVKLSYSADGSRTHIPADVNGLTVQPSLVTPADVTTFRLVSASSTNDTSVVVAGTFVRIHGYQISNTSTTAWAFLKVYDTSTVPIVGSDTPEITIGVPPGAQVSQSFPFGVKVGTVSSGMGIGITQLGDDADMTAVGATEVVVNIMYETV